jgi:hypothetical protein
MYGVHLIIGLIVVPVLRLMKALLMVLTSNVNASYQVIIIWQMRMSFS